MWSLSVCASPHLQLAAGESSTQRVTVMRVDEDGSARWEVTGACRELDEALCGTGGSGASLPPGCMAHLQAMLALWQQLRTLL